MVNYSYFIIGLLIKNSVLELKLHIDGAKYKSIMFKEYLGIFECKQ